MSKGRQQKWVCMECAAEFSVQGRKPKLCCDCGSDKLCRAPSIDLANAYSQKREELSAICSELNAVYGEYEKLKAKYDSNMAYWKAQKSRGFISQEEYTELANQFSGHRSRSCSGDKNKTDKTG